MVKAVTISEAKDGTRFDNKNAAEKYEKGLVLGENIDALPISPEAQDFLKANWGDINNMVRAAGGVVSDVRPYQSVPDVNNPRPVLKELKAVKKKPLLITGPKRKPGRPPKAEVVEKKKPGRPPKDKVVAKRGPGRPAKKRGPGRPKKS